MLLQASLDHVGTWWSSAPVWGTYENGTFPDGGMGTVDFFFFHLLSEKEALSLGHDVYDFLLKATFVDLLKILNVSFFLELSFSFYLLFIE